MESSASSDETLGGTVFIGPKWRLLRPPKNRYHRALADHIREPDVRDRLLIFIVNIAALLAGCVAPPPQRPAAHPPADVMVAAPPGAALYLPASAPDLYRLLPPPPEAGSAQQRAELDELLRLQATRTPAMVQRAREDVPRSIFRFADALGSPAEFTAQRLPLTARFFAQIEHDGAQYADRAKDVFARPRPFRSERRLAPAVAEPSSPSYPSFHSTWAVACGIVLADMVPERRAAIFARADEFAHNREVGGVHYPSDVAAGHLAGTALAEEFFSTPRFLADEAAATTELRQALGLPPLPPRVVP